MAQMKEQIKTPEKYLSKEDITNLSDTDFKTLVIMTLTEMTEYGCKTEEDLEAMQSEINKNIQGTNSEGKEIGMQINNLDHKAEIHIQPEQNEETRIQKTEERLRSLRENFKHSNIWIIGVPEGEEEEHKTENLFEKIMKENVPNLVKEIHFQEVQEVQRIPNKLDPRR